MGGREGLIFASTAAVSAIFFLPCSQIFRTTTSRAVQVSMRRDILCVMLGLSLSGGLVEGGEWLGRCWPPVVGEASATMLVLFHLGICVERFAAGSVLQW